MAAETEGEIPGERAHTTTSGRSDNPLLKRGAVVIAVVAFIGFSLWSMGEHRPRTHAGPRQAVIRETAQFEPAEQKPAPPPQVAPVKLPTPVAPKPVAKADDSLLDAARRAPVMAFGAQQNPPPHRQAAKPASASGSDYLPLDGDPARFGGRTGNEDERFSRMLAPTRLEGSRAGTLGNRDFIVAMGTSIPCVLETALSSDEPGFAELCDQSRRALRQWPGGADGERH